MHYVTANHKRNVFIDVKRTTGITMQRETN